MLNITSYIFNHLITLCLSLAIFIVSSCSPLMAPEIKKRNLRTNINDENSTNCSGKDCTTAQDKSSGDQNSESKGEVLGLIEDENSSISDFAGISTYATYNDTIGLVITVSNIEEYDTRFRKIESFECRDCSGDDDPNCQSTDQTPAAVSYLNLTFSKKNAFAGDDYLNDENGWPIADENSNDPLNDDNEYNDNFPLGNGLSISFSDGVSSLMMMGDAVFAEGKRPEKMGDAYELTVTSRATGGETYEAKLKGKVYETHAMPAYPTDCSLDDNKYVHVNYE